MKGLKIKGIMPQLKKKIFIPIFCWTVFIAYELSLTYYSYGKLEPFYIYVLFYSLNIAYFYGYVRLLDYTFDRAGPRYLKGLSGYLFLLIVYQCIKRELDHFFYSPKDIEGPMQYLKAVFPTYLFRTIYFTILATFYWVSGYLAFYKRQAEEAEKKQLIIARDKAEIHNALLQQQINPHMLFNTLNFIFSDVYQASPQAGRSILLLSDILRFGLEASGGGQTLISDELDHVRQLLEINRYRFHHHLNLTFSTQGDFTGVRIIPLILLTLTENVFKHGNLEDKDCPASILINMDNDRKLVYQSINLKKSGSEEMRSSQLGLQNILLRLDYAYPGKYQLDIKDDTEIYELTLSIYL